MCDPPPFPDRPWGDGENDDVDEGFESEGSSGNEYDRDLFEPSGPASPPPPLDAVLEPVVQRLADEVLGQFFPASPSDQDSSFLPRASSSSSRNGEGHIPINTSASAPSSPSSSLGRTFACPYYVRDPAAHAPCLTRAVFPRLLDLRRHLQTTHRRPPYCPVCRLTFGRATARDAHVRSFSCTPPSSDTITAPPAGLADPQLRQLARRPDPAAADSAQWAGLWRLCFGGDEAAPPLPPSPYAEDASPVAARVARARAFWAAARYRGLGPASWPRALTEAGRAALQAAVLERMLDKLVLDTSPVGGEPSSATEDEV